MVAGVGVGGLISAMLLTCPKDKILSRRNGRMNSFILEQIGGYEIILAVQVGVKMDSQPIVDQFKFFTSLFELEALRRIVSDSSQKATLLNYQINSQLLIIQGIVHKF
jgi:hypothetical protein